MRFLMMHRLDERDPVAWNPGGPFIERMGAFIQESAAQGVLVSGEGVLPSAQGALVRKTKAAETSVTDGPFTEAKEVIGGFAVINAEDLAAAVRFAQRYTELFEDVEIEVEVRRIAEFEDVGGPV